MSRLLSTKNGLFSIATLLLAVAFVQCQQKADEWESYGEVISGAESASTSKMLSEVSASDTIPVKFTATIEEVCQMKGCWMTLKSESGERIRVTFKDYGFFVPKDAAGREVVIDGFASLSMLDEATAQHYADDSGREYNPETDRKEVSIIASGVLIEKAAQL